MKKSCFLPSPGVTHCEEGTQIGGVLGCVALAERHQPDAPRIHLLDSLESLVVDGCTPANQPVRPATLGSPSVSGRELPPDMPPTIKDAPMRNRIGGLMDHHAMACLHRPDDPEVLAREARPLADRGLTARDVAAALGLDAVQVTKFLQRQEVA